MLGLNWIARGGAAVGLAVLVAANSSASPASSGEATRPAGRADRASWDWVEELEAAVNAGDGRPTLLEFHYTALFA